MPVIPEVAEMGEFCSKKEIREFCSEAEIRGFLV
jgi:hypothetical protein